MSESNSENNSDNSGGVGISDDQLPEDLVPSEDNPLAEGLPPGEAADDLLTEGKQADETEDEQPDDEGEG